MGLGLTHSVFKGMTLAYAVGSVGIYGTYVDSIQECVLINYFTFAVFSDIFSIGVDCFPVRHESAGHLATF